MDSFGEQLISKKITAADWIKRICLILGGLLTATFCMTLSFTTGFYVLTMIAVGILFGMVWILGGMSCEYEYIITNDDLDIDKIMGKKKKKTPYYIKAQHCGRIRRVRRLTGRWSAGYRNRFGRKRN